MGLSRKVAPWPWRTTTHTYPHPTTRTHLQTYTHQGRIQDLWKGEAQRLPRAPQARRFLEGPVWRPSLEFQKGGARPLRPSLNPLVHIHTHTHLHHPTTHAHCHSPPPSLRQEWSVILTNPDEERQKAGRGRQESTLKPRRQTSLALPHFGCGIDQSH